MSGDDTVGYKKPPKNKQFKKGQSGNRNGRPKKVKQSTSDIVAILSEPVAVNNAGVAQLMSPFEACVRKLVSRALHDKNVNAALELVRMCETFDVVLPPPTPQDIGQVWIIPRNFDTDEWKQMYDKLGPPPWPGERSGLCE